MSNSKLKSQIKIIKKKGNPPAMLYMSISNENSIRSLWDWLKERNYKIIFMNVYWKSYVKTQSPKKYGTFTESSPPR